MRVASSGDTRGQPRDTRGTSGDTKGPAGTGVDKRGTSGGPRGTSKGHQGTRRDTEEHGGTRKDPEGQAGSSGVKQGQAGSSGVEQGQAGSNRDGHGMTPNLGVKQGRPHDPQFGGHGFWAAGRPCESIYGDWGVVACGCVLLFCFRAAVCCCAAASGCVLLFCSRAAVCCCAAACGCVLLFCSRAAVCCCAAACGYGCALCPRGPKVKQTLFFPPLRKSTRVPQASGHLPGSGVSHKRSRLRFPDIHSLRPKYPKPPAICPAQACRTSGAACDS